MNHLNLDMSCATQEATQFYQWNNYLVFEVDKNVCTKGPHTQYKEEANRINF